MPLFLQVRELLQKHRDDHESERKRAAEEMPARGQIKPPYGRQL